MSTRSIPALFATGAVMLAVPARGLDPAAFCSGDPCVVSQDVTVDANFSHDYSPVDVRVAAGVTIAVADGVTSFAFDGANVVFEPGSSVRALGPDAFVAVTATAGNVVVGTDAGRVGFLLRDGPGIEIFAEQDVVANVAADVSGRDNEAGAFAIQAGGDIDLSGKVKANGTPEWCNGEIDLDAGGNLTYDAKFVGRGRGQGCAIARLAAANAFIGGTVDVSSRPGYGGTIDITTTQDLALTGKLKARGGQDRENIGGNCAGGLLTMAVGGSATLDGRLDLRGGGEQCEGGALAANVAGALTQTERAPIRTGNGGDSGLGGSVGITVGGAAQIHTIDVQGDQAGAITVAAGGTLDVAGRLRAESVGLSSAWDGSVDLSGACGLTLAGTAQIDAAQDLLSNGIVDLRTSGGPMVIDGSVTASGAVTLHYVTGFDPVVNGAVVPAPGVVESPPPGTCGS